MQFHPRVEALLQAMLLSLLVVVKIVIEVGEICRVYFTGLYTVCEDYSASAILVDIGFVLIA